MKQVNEIMGDVCKALNDTKPGLPTGLSNLDRALNGISQGQFVTLAARPSMGKTAFAGDIILAQKEPVLFFSLEMSEVVVVQRMIANLANVNFRQMLRGKLKSDEVKRVQASMSDLSKRPIFIEDMPCITPTQYISMAKACPQAKLIVVDYLQLMRHEDGRLGEVQALDQISQAIKGYSKQTGVPTVVLSQLNRKADEREGHEPRLSDLRGSGAIEQVSDVVLLLHRPAYYLQREIDFETDDDGEAWIIIGKQRNGVTGKIKSVFIGEYMSFRDCAQDGMDSWR
jgi:replicative DNA helicase